MEVMLSILEDGAGTGGRYGCRSFSRSAAESSRPPDATSLRYNSVTVGLKGGMLGEGMSATGLSREIAVGEGVAAGVRRQLARSTVGILTNYTLISFSSRASIRVQMELCAACSYQAT